MIDTIQREPFIEVHEFTGTLSDGSDLVVTDLHVVISYSKNNRGKIYGKIYGTDATSESLAPIANSSSKLLSLYSKNSEGEFFSNQVLIQQQSYRQQVAQKRNTVTYEVMSLELFEFSKIDYVDTELGGKRLLTFFLTGPKNIWPVYQAMTCLDTGEIKNNIDDLSLELDKRFTIIVRPVYFYDKIANPIGAQISTYTIAICFETEVAEEELSDEQLVNEGKSFVEDIVLLASFLCKHWAAWYAYTLVTKKSVHFSIESRQRASEIRINRDEIPIDLRRMKDFFQIAGSRLRSLRREDIDLTLPLTYYISGNEAKYTEEQFVKTFLGLEKLKDIYAQKYKLEKNLSNTKFDKIKTKLSEMIKQEIEDTELAANICDKLPELNRPKLRTILDKLFDTYNIKWDDIYPQNSQFSLIKTRDILFHSSKEVTTYELFLELQRLQILLTRVFLRILDWEDLSRTVKGYQL